jgi:hypothetical protein
MEELKANFAQRTNYEGVQKVRFAVITRAQPEAIRFIITDFEDTENRNVIKMHFAHKNTGEKCYAYCACKDKGILGRHPFYLKVMVKGNSPDEPAFVTVCEKETAVKICTNNHFRGWEHAMRNIRNEQIFFNK